MAEILSAPTPDVDYNFAAAEQEFQPENPSEYLASLPQEGFASEQQREVVISQIDAVGLPVDNYRSLAYRRNEHGRENVLGSWGLGAENYGQFSVYELLDRVITEDRLATIVHESAHANNH